MAHRQDIKKGTESRQIPRGLLVILLLSLFVHLTLHGDEASQIAREFEEKVQPWLTQFCIQCHDADKMKSGIRVDILNGQIEENHLRLWETIQGQLTEGLMPPDDEPQPTEEERNAISQWIDSALHLARSRDIERNGSVRPLTVSQYRQTLCDLLGIENNYSKLLPPDAISKDGFHNNKEAMLVSPLSIETYFEIAEMALDECLVDPSTQPVIQNFRMDLGKGLNPDPLNESLILGANSHLLPNSDFTVSELSPEKPFPYTPFAMQRKLRFIEGYQGNDTVRGWRDYDSIYHSVFACMRGSEGYPLGNPYDLVPEGLLLRPAIPSAEIFEVDSTYGPKANFKVSLRQLPNQGRFRVTVHAARYNDAMLLDSNATRIGSGTIVSAPTMTPREVNISEPGVYQVEVYRIPPPGGTLIPDATKLEQAKLGSWSFDSGLAASPFGNAISIHSEKDVVVIPHQDSLNVGEGEFTVAAWIRPRSLQQGGIVAKGAYGRRGWVFDMPNGNGVLRIETHKDYQQGSGTVQTRPGTLRQGIWQHVAAVVRRGTNNTRLFVNGFEVASGTVQEANLDNPDIGLNIGRVPGAQLFPGEIDEARIYGRALAPEEIQALVEPGRSLVTPPPDGRQTFSIQMGDRSFTSTLNQEPFLMVRLPAGPLEVKADYTGIWQVEKLVLARVCDPTAFECFERRAPLLGVHLGLRRDCGSTLDPVGPPQMVSNTNFTDFIFEGAINDFPNPDVEKDNVNYISGLREIGVRSEYTDGLPRPRLVIRSIEFEGPHYDTWPPEPHRRIFISEDPVQILRNFATRAFRRPITPEEEVALTDTYRSSFAATGNLTRSIRDVLVTLLTSPQFLLLLEESQGPESEPLSPYELASKLSYFLWNSPPDTRLLTLAEKESIHQGLDSEIDRLIQDPRFERFTDEFVSQWLSLDKLDSVETDRTRFPRLTRDTKKQLRLEPVRFVEHLIRRNLPLRHLVQSEWLMANEVVAAYYGLGGSVETGFTFTPIRHGDRHLGGLLSQAGILAALSNGREANPIKRGAWFARKIIAKPPADPPPNVPQLPEDDDHLTLRQKLERHRNQEGCVKCHQGIDPWGFPFEQFDAGGRFISETDVDASSVLPDKTLVSDLNSLKAYLAEDHLNLVTFSFLKHLATYAVGRPLSYNEVELLRKKALDSSQADCRTQDLVRWLVHSDIFLKK